jgi:hypothetical protein
MRVSIPAIDARAMSGVVSRYGLSLPDRADAPAPAPAGQRTGAGDQQQYRQRLEQDADAHLRRRPGGLPPEGALIRWSTPALA